MVTTPKEMTDMKIFACLHILVIMGYFQKKEFATSYREQIFTQE